VHPVRGWQATMQRMLLQDGAAGCAAAEGCVIEIAKNVIAVLFGGALAGVIELIVRALP
jgi:hypothetical protein